MKTPATLILALSFTLGSLSAQTVPLFFNYQGKIASGTGAPLGSTGAPPGPYTAAPLNRKVLFRLYDAQTAGTLLWSEQQTATFSLGEFSVLLGQGTAGVYNGVTETRPALDTVFTTGGAVPTQGPLRYLEIVVDDGSGTFTTTDVPIAPRQRITTTGYAFRARMADTVAASGIVTAALADGSVTAVKVADNSITTLKIADGQVTSAKILDNSVTAAKIADGSVTSAKIADGTIVAADILDGTIGTNELANASVTVAKIDPASIGLWTVGGTSVYRPAGSVGIGKVPTVALDVVGGVTATGVLSGAGVNISGTAALELGAGVAGKEPAAGKILYQGYSTALDIVGAGTTATNRKVKLWAEGGTEITGRVGIGAGGANPSAPLHVFGNASTSFNWQAALDGNGFVSDQNATVTRSATIIAEGTIRASQVDISSDARIKKVISRTNSADDLATLMDLEVTNYTFKDVAANGSAPQKKVIAQQVEAVFPQAVSQSTNVVPDIFRMAAFNDGWVTLATDLKPGERVRLIGSKGEGIHEVLEVSEGRFRTIFTTEGDKVFVYGREVKDFRAVDYDAIAMLNVSATQQIKKEKDAEVKGLDAEVKALREENAALKKQLTAQEPRLAGLEASEKAREAKFAALEQLLQSAAGTRTVSLKTSAAAK